MLWVDAMGIGLKLLFSCVVVFVVFGNDRPAVCGGEALEPLEMMVDEAGNQCPSFSGSEGYCSLFMFNAMVEDSEFDCVASLLYCLILKGHFHTVAHVKCYS